MFPWLLERLVAQPGSWSHRQPKLWLRRVSATALAGLVVGSLAGCPARPKAEEKIAEDTKAAEGFQGDLVFKNVTLNNSSPDGKLQWEVKAQEARYSRDRKYARLIKPSGKLYDKGEVVYEVTAGLGEIVDNGQVLKVRERVLAKNLREKSNFRAAEATWGPTEAKLEVAGGFVMTHPQARVSGREATSWTRDRRLEARRKINLRSQDGKLVFSSEKLTWDLAKEEVRSTETANTPKGSQRLQVQPGGRPGTPDAAPITVTAQTLLWNLKDQQVMAQDKAQAVRQSPPTKGAPNSKTSLSADRLVWNLKENYARALGNPVLVGQQPAASLRADLMTWEMKNDAVLAIGQVSAMGTDPPVNLRSDRAIWQLKAGVAQAVGHVVAVGQDPPMNLVADRIIWQISTQVLQAVGNAQGVGQDPPVAIAADRLVWQAKERIATAIGNARGSGQDPPVAIAADRLVWQVKEKVAQAIGGVRASGQKPAMDLSAERVLWQMGDQVAHALGNAIVVSRDPNLRVQTDHLLWQMRPQVVSSDRRTLVDRYRCPVGTAACAIADRAAGNGAQVNLRNKAAWLYGNAQVSAVDPPVDVASESLRWNFQTEQVAADAPVTVIDRRQQIVLNALRGALDLRARLGELTGQVRGTSARRQASLTTDRLLWAIDRQEVQAIGHVVYQQANPYLLSRGNRALGLMKEGQIVLSSGAGSRASSTFFPETASPARSPSPSPTGTAPVAPPGPLVALGSPESPLPSPLPLPALPSDLAAGSLPPIPAGLFSPGGDRPDDFLAPFIRDP